MHVKVCIVVSLQVTDTRLISYDKLKTKKGEFMFFALSLQALYWLNSVSFMHLEKKQVMSLFLSNSSNTALKIMNLSALLLPINRLFYSGTGCSISLTRGLAVFFLYDLTVWEKFPAKINMSLIAHAEAVNHILLVLSENGCYSWEILRVTNGAGNWHFLLSV